MFRPRCAGDGVHPGGAQRGWQAGPALPRTPSARLHARRGLAPAPGTPLQPPRSPRRAGSSDRPHTLSPAEGRAARVCPAQARRGGSLVQQGVHHAHHQDLGHARACPGLVVLALGILHSQWSQQLRACLPLRFIFRNRNPRPENPNILRLYSPSSLASSLPEQLTHQCGCLPGCEQSLPLTEALPHRPGMRGCLAAQRHESHSGQAEQLALMELLAPALWTPLATGS